MPAEPRSRVRVVIAGDALVSAMGDSKGMGWVGRVIARTPSAPTSQNAPLIEILALPMPNETTQGLSGRWMSEIQARFEPGIENRLVLAPGNLDPAAGVSMSRSRLNVANILDEAKKLGISSFLVGPAPHRNEALNDAIAGLSEGFADVAKRRDVPYVDCFTPLVAHEGWWAELSGSESGLPGQVGYGLLAWLVLHRGWFEWLDLPLDA